MGEVRIHKQAELRNDLVHAEFYFYMASEHCCSCVSICHKTYAPGFVLLLYRSRLKGVTVADLDLGP